MILVTGATGFIGSYLISEFEKNNFDYRVVCRTLSKHYKFKFQVDSIDSETCWDGAFENVSTVVHLAGLAHGQGTEPCQFDDINHLGTVRLARHAIKIFLQHMYVICRLG